MVMTVSFMPYYRRYSLFFVFMLTCLLASATTHQLTQLATALHLSLVEENDRFAAGSLQQKPNKLHKVIYRLLLANATN